LSETGEEKYSPESDSLISSPNPSTSGQAASLTATVTPHAAPGSVQFFDGATPLGAANPSGGAATSLLLR